MANITIGDFVTLKNHPYHNDFTFIKIAALSELTPPVMIVTEYVNKEEYNETTGENSERQFKCIYYSHKDGKFHDKWFKDNSLKKLILKHSNLIIDKLEDIEKFDLQYLKKEFINSLVCLKNVDFELNKKKVFIDSSDGKRINKENNHLDFLPPVMTIIDVVKNKEERRYSKNKPNTIEKDCTKYQFKCKWFNPISSTFSEDYFSTNVLGIVNFDSDFISHVDEIIKENDYILYDLEKEISLEDSIITIKKSLMTINDLVLNHYYYNLAFYDKLFHRSGITKSNKIFIEGNINRYKENEIFDKILPEIIDNTLKSITSKSFIKNEYYLIRYINRFDKITDRVIKARGNIKIIDGESYTTILLQANCLLRNGFLRNFNIERIISSKHIKDGIKLFE